MLRSRSPKGRSQGFTLIEVLVSIAIFASLSVAAYQVVNQVQLSNELSKQKSIRLQEIQRAFVFLDGDFRQIALRQFRHEGEEATSRLLLWGQNVLASDDKGVLFTRLGWLNPLNQFPRGEVSKVGYRIQDGTLERLWWRYPDTPVAEPAIELPLLEGVEAFGLRFYAEGEWSNEWTADLALPSAVEVTLKLVDYGEISRIYLTTEGVLNVAAPGDPNQNTDNSSGNDSGADNGNAGGDSPQGGS
ncbi:type II secretion system minor pseudopilin GspJ [Vibrio sp. ZSDZ34]|jgi:general secretion pathway protein J|uniref:Type II secretion system protein J n=1 Tax=Vibrio gelatinilyticus TaxID=2893468 RepID=A0A9X2AXC5_9VIBR|nr:type II secretion system minor pseudopilin GspJ [Vibrio gelatinilyticus]MCJ2378879.1 type II secretion system minor pseudopilin GspJ [Vibrio gelatinilyticus]